MRKTKHRGIGRVAATFLLNLIAYNLFSVYPKIGRNSVAETPCRPENLQPPKHRPTRKNKSGDFRKTVKVTLFQSA